jgi:hypothetical protein
MSDPAHDCSEEHRREHEAPEGWGWMIDGDLLHYPSGSVAVDRDDPRALRDGWCGRWTGGRLVWCETVLWGGLAGSSREPDRELGPLLRSVQLGHFTTSGATVTCLRGQGKG